MEQRYLHLSQQGSITVCYCASILALLLYERTVFPSWPIRTIEASNRDEWAIVAALRFVLGFPLLPAARGLRLVNGSFATYCVLVGNALVVGPASVHVLRRSGSRQFSLRTAMLGLLVSCAIATDIALADAYPFAVTSLLATILLVSINLKYLHTPRS